MEALAENELVGVASDESVLVPVLVLLADCGAVRDGSGDDDDDFEAVREQGQGRQRRRCAAEQVIQALRTRG